MSGCEVIALSDRCKEHLLFSLLGSPNPLPEKFMTYLDLNACAMKSVVCKRHRVNKLGDLKPKSLTFSGFLGYIIFPV